MQKRRTTQQYGGDSIALVQDFRADGKADEGVGPGEGEEVGGTVAEDAVLRGKRAAADHLRVAGPRGRLLTLLSRLR